MCGICGYIAPEKLNDEGMLHALAHRGPDCMGSKTSVIHQKKMFLGHTRLSVIDLSDKGNQPMSAAGGSIHLVFNGEIYNFEKLKEQFLQERPFTSASDTEVFLGMYERFGTDCISHFNGDFAAAILDENRDELILVRDRMGVKPLYYFREGERFVFASEIRSILAAGVKAGLNEEQLQNFFVFKYVPGNETLFRGIRRLPPAHFMRIKLDTSQTEVRRYWNPSDEKTQMDYGEAGSQLKSLVEDAVRMRLVADVPVGNFLSGGLDSSIIAGCTKDREDIRHYCAVKSPSDLRKEGTTSDIRYARMLAGRWGLHLEEVDIGGALLKEEMLQKVVRHSDDLVADGSMIPSWLIAQRASQRSVVLLSGMGADELFLGYAGHQLTLLARKMDALPGCMRKTIWKCMADIHPGRGRLKPYRRWLHKLGKYGSNEASRYAFFSIVGDVETALSLFRDTAQFPLDFISGYFGNDVPPFEALLKFETENFLVKNLHYTDRMAMAHAVEVRVPYLDHRIVEFAHQIPDAFKMKSIFKPKRILKDSFSQLLPGEITKRRKAGFGMPLRSIFANPSVPDALIDHDFFADLGLFSAQSVRQAVGAHLSGMEDNSSLIFALIIFQYWYREYINQ